MKHKFKSAFAEDLASMIEMMQALGYASSTYMPRAMSLDAYCCQNHPTKDELSEDVLMGWISSGGNATGSIHAKVVFARGFATYLRSIGKTAHMIADGYVSGRSMFVPYIFTDEELTNFFCKLDQYEDHRNPFFSTEMSLYFRMTYMCGLRPREGRILRRSDVDLGSGELRILESKRHTSRIVVMSEDLCRITRSYVILRDTAYPSSEYLFPDATGGLHTSSRVQNYFRRIFALSKPNVPKELLPPVRVYDLRHRFATAVLNKWLDERKDLNSRIPYLQTYMGHRNKEATAYYVHLLPENLLKSAGIDWKELNQLFPRAELWEEK